MDKLLSLFLLWPCLLSVCAFNPDQDLGGWTSSGQSPAKAQLLTWAKNQTFGPSRATSLHGIPVPSLTASQAIGTSGPVLMQDFLLMEKSASFNRERIPERAVHAKGAGAHGHFTVTHDIGQYTKAKFLNGIGKKTRVFVRFSTVFGELGSADTEVGPNGFATKFYTEEGNHDIVGNNIETFALRDPIMFSDMNRSRKRNPQTNMKDQNMWWDFVSLRPESTLHTLQLFSDIGRPKSYRSMDGFGVHAFKCVNKYSEVTFCKFIFKSLQPSSALTHQQSSQLAGINPEYKTQDLFDAIASKKYPSWDLFLQVMTVEQARSHPVNPFDITRPWGREDYPLIPVGRLTLNGNPEDYFAEVEQVGMSPANMVPGIEPSPDRVLAGRLFAYPDALRYRLGVNFPQLPINKPVAAVHSYMRNGRSCYGINGGGSPNYHPNSFGGHFADTRGAGQTAFAVEGIVDRYDIPEDEHAYARMFLEREVDADHRDRLVDSIAVRLKDAASEIRERTLRNIFYPISKTFGDEIRDAVEKYLHRDKIIESSLNEMDNFGLFNKFDITNICNQFSK